MPKSSSTETVLDGYSGMFNDSCSRLNLISICRNYKVVSTTNTRTWSYRDAVLSGLLTRDAKDFFDEGVCDPYRAGSQSVRKGEKRAEVMAIQKNLVADRNGSESMMEVTPSGEEKMARKIRRHRARRAAMGHSSGGTML